MSRLGLKMRERLILLFVTVVVIPLVLLTIISISQFNYLGEELKVRIDSVKEEANNSLDKMAQIAIDDSVEALKNSTIIQLERTSTDLANNIAAFLYQRDNDILYAAGLLRSENTYRHFLQYKTGKIVKQREWGLTVDGKAWIPIGHKPEGTMSPSTNGENNSGYRNRPPDLMETEDRPLYLEMTFVDTEGYERIKVTTSSQTDRELKNVSNRLNTYIKAETYFNELKQLKPGEIYVSDVIGEYVGSRLIGMYTPEVCADRGQPFRPWEEAFAGKENPLGKRFKGLIRWATPIAQGGQIIGYVTLALDHDHIMEFVDRITPMDERYVEMPSAYEGNYAFIWDYQCRCIAHPRHHSIVGYDSETGEPQVPWLEESIYNDWLASGLPYAEFIKSVPVFQEQSRNKRLAQPLTSEGLVGLDGRYLNNAPQCTGWFDLTKEGGSGSFLIFWSGIWKPNTAATIPYYTGNYGKTKRGFGFVAIGAGLEDFQRPARETEKQILEIIEITDTVIIDVIQETTNLISGSMVSNALKIGLIASGITLVMIVILIWIASSFSASINNLVIGISHFHAGERHFRFIVPVNDEIGKLAKSFNAMADSLAESDRGPVIITNNEEKIIYSNELTSLVFGFKREEIVGKQYNEISIYPCGTEYDPIKALKEDSEASIMYHKELERYFVGQASYLTDEKYGNIGYVITSTDVTDFMEQQKQLEEAVIEAKLANEHKGNFLARMSHEIRTPMNAIIGMTGIVKKKLSSNTYNLNDVLVNISQIETSSVHLLGLLNDILDISKIEAEKIELAMESADIRKIGAAVALIIQPRCNEKNIAFETIFDLPENAFYMTDPLRLRQVLINLLGNAVKFTGETGKITFTIQLLEKREEKSCIKFSVRDSGIGIPDDIQKTLFKPFQQADNTISQKYGGTGLGLAICKSIVQMFGGDIKVISAAGAGSEFFFEIWLQGTEAAREKEIQVKDIANRLVGKKALLVDDVEINRVIAMNMLENTGIEIDEACDGAEAVKIISESKENEYDIIYMDVQMPVMNGYDAANAIRALQRKDAKTIPIVAMTANAFKEDIDKALENGMNAHIAKPMDLEKTLEVTFRMLE